jgi:hypothetical protein
VTELDPEWIGNLYQVRGALDTLAERPQGCAPKTSRP